jgi:hypothetical protein
VKSSVTLAKAKASAIIASDPTAVVIGVELPPISSAETEPEKGNTGWIYVMRCPLIEEDVYKIGWSSCTPKVRAVTTFPGNRCAFGVYCG